jgi:hypothetical protein
VSTVSQHGFEQRLLRELRRVVDAQRLSVPAASSASTPAAARFHRGRRWTIGLGLAAGLGAAAVIAVPVLSGDGGGTPAYAVTARDDGTVMVEINSLKDAAGLERKLRDAGVPAVVQYIPPGKACKHPTFTPAPAGTRTPMGAGMSGSVSQSGDHRARFTIDKRAVQPDRTLVIQTQQGAAPANMPTGPSSIGIAWAKGSVRPCELVDAPAGSMLPPPGPTPRTTGREKPSLNTETGHRQGLDATPPAAGTYRTAPGDPGHAPAN